MSLGYNAFKEESRLIVSSSSERVSNIYDMSHTLSLAAPVSERLTSCYNHGACVLISERTNHSIQQLSSGLEQKNPDGSEMLEVGDSDDGRFFPIMSDEEKQAWSQKKGSEAG